MIGLRDRDLIRGGVIHRVFFQPPDIQGIVDQVPAAPLFTGMLADKSAGGGKGIVLPDHLHCPGVIVLRDEGDIARDVHVGRTEVHTGHLLPDLLGTDLVVHMAFILFPEGLQALQDFNGRLIADGAVGGIPDHLRQGFHLVQCLRRPVSVQDPLHHPLQLGQAVPAGDAFAAGLVFRRRQHGELYCQRAGPGRVHPDLGLKFGKKPPDLYVHTVLIRKQMLIFRQRLTPPFCIKACLPV